MKYKQLVLQKLEQLTNSLHRAETAANQSNAQTFYDTLEFIKEQVNQLHQLVDSEQEG